ncbi:helix-turn-helix transcriptional regulator [Litoreibacter albidus]|uniref:helix-turn-helix transcriptional regulator n=1 Tax=Litoreibacter albidus TaxID=670155 RepID=UPI001FCD6065|nr:AraC family transcriptional regulator [Litoreibacter albidus]
MDVDYFGLIDFIRESKADEVKLVATYSNMIKVDDLGILGLAIKTAPTLRDSLHRVERYYRLVTDTAIYRLDDSGNPALWIFEVQTPHHTALEFRNECALGAFASNLKRIVGPELKLEFVTFRHTCRGDPQRYAELFGCPVRFSADLDAIALDPSMLRLSNVLGDKGVSDYLTSHLDAKFSSVEEDASLSNALVYRLTPTLSAGVPHAADLAKELGMSERTLYRRLAAEGLTFRDVLARAQSALAKELLRDSTASIAEIAFLTGFSEQSTFSRAFKRWVGEAPARFRQVSQLDIRSQP